MKKAFLAIAMALSALFGGCFPENIEYQSNIFLSLPLKQIGISPTQQNLDRWRQHWQAAAQTFELGMQEQNFYLGIGLTCGDIIATLQGTDEFVTISEKNNEKYLDINLYTSDCDEGIFKIAIYWLTEQYGVEFFSGASPPAKIPTAEMTIDVYKHPTASAFCNKYNAYETGEHLFAARDVTENVRLPPVTSQSDGTYASFNLSQLPIGRNLVVQHAYPQADGGMTWKDAPKEFFLTTAGEATDVCYTFNQ